MRKGLEYKLAFYKYSAYIFRGCISCIFFILVLIAQTKNFSSQTSFIIALIAFFWGGELFIRGTLHELIRGYIGFNAFTSITTFGAVVFSLLKQVYPDTHFVVNGINLLIPLIFCVSNFIKAFELMKLKNSFHFLESIDNFVPKSCNVLIDSKSKKVFSEEVKIGDIIILKTAERLAVDGKIIKGSSIFDEQLLTGNITFVSKQVGDEVLAGSVNKGKEVQIQVSCGKKFSHIARVLQAVKESEKKKITKVSILETCATKMFLFVVFMAFVWAIFFYFQSSKQNDYIGALLAFSLFLACGCPLFYLSAVIFPMKFLGGSIRKGKIIINEVDSLYKIINASKIFIDKTGTLTSGKLEVAEIVCADGVKEDVLMKSALTAQQSAQNIFASALKLWGQENKIIPYKITSVEIHPSYGALVHSGKDVYLTGRRTWLIGKGINVPLPQEEISKTAFYVAKNDKYLGCVYFTDRLRINTQETIKYLTDVKKQICLVSGDNSLAISAVAQKTNITEFYGNMYPSDKAAKIASQQNVGESIVMIGDGFNDILALLQADASIAFAPTNSLFSTWVDITIKGSDFSLIKTIFEVYKKQQNIIKQNVLVCCFYSLVLYYVFLQQISFTWLHFLCGLIFFVLIIFLNSWRLKNE